MEQAFRYRNGTTWPSRSPWPPSSPSPTWVTTVWTSITTDPSPVCVIYVGGTLPSIFFYIWLLSYSQEITFRRCSHRVRWNFRLSVLHCAAHLSPRPSAPLVSTWALCTGAILMSGAARKAGDHISRGRMCTFVPHGR